MYNLPDPQLHVDKKACTFPRGIEYWLVSDTRYRIWRTEKLPKKVKLFTCNQHESLAINATFLRVDL